MSCLYILEIKPLLVASFTNIFSHSVAFFILFMFSFAVLVSLIRSHLFTFVFIGKEDLGEECSRQKEQPMQEL